MTLSILLFLVLSISLYLLLCSAAKLPTISTTLAALRIAHPKQVRGNLIHVIVYRLSACLARFIHLQPAKKAELATKLSMAKSDVAPEFHIAKIIANLILRLIFVIPAAIVFPLIGIFVAGWAVYCLWGDLSWLDKAVKARRDRIDADMPRLASTLSQELKASRDVIGILTAYQPSAAPDFREELKKTLADMNSGSPDKALTRMGTRVGSSMLYEIIRGLQAVLHGDNGVAYFQLLEHDFKQTELQNLGLIAKKRPGKVQFNAFLMLGCLMFSALLLLVLYAYSKVGGFV
ncbi:MAG TPA: secretion protein F [Caproicibacter sp.]|nr:secretion protein F [Caproicibacter sp.]